MDSHQNTFEFTLYDFDDGTHSLIVFFFDFKYLIFTLWSSTLLVRISLMLDVN